MKVKGFLDKIRTRVLWVSVGTLATALGVVVLAAAPVWPVVGAAVVGWALAVSTLAKNWQPSRCYGCGTSIAEAPIGSHGSICPTCGAINEVIDVAGPDAKPKPGYDDLA